MTFRIINSNSFSRWRNWDLEKLRDLTQAHLAFRGRAQLLIFELCTKGLTFLSDAVLITTKIYNPQKYRMLYGWSQLLSCEVSIIIIPFSQIYNWSSEKSTDMYKELLEKVGLKNTSSAEETAMLPELHRNVLSIFPTYLHRRMYLLKRSTLFSK